MIIPFTLLFGAIGYLYYKSKDEVSLIEPDQLDTLSEKQEEDDLYNLELLKVILMLFAKTHEIRMQT